MTINQGVKFQPPSSHRRRIITISLCSFLLSARSSFQILFYLPVLLHLQQSIVGVYISPFTVKAAISEQQKRVQSLSGWDWIMVLKSIKSWSFLYQLLMIALPSDRAARAGGNLLNIAQAPVSVARNTVRRVSPSHVYSQCLSYRL